MPSERRRRAHLEHVIRSEETAHGTKYGFTASVVPATGPQGSRANLARSKLLILPALRRRDQTGSARTIASMARCSLPNSTRSASRACSIASAICSSIV